MNGGVESTRGHGYMMANLIASLSTVSMRLWPLAGMGLMRGFCVYVRAQFVFLRVLSHVNGQKRSPCPEDALSSTAGAG